MIELIVFAKKKTKKKLCKAVNEPSLLPELLICSEVVVFITVCKVGTAKKKKYRAFRGIDGIIRNCC